MSKPFFDHDCKNCIFMGNLQFLENNKWKYEDYYYCVENEVVAVRTGVFTNEIQYTPVDYPRFTHRALITALLLAIKKGYVRIEDVNLRIIEESD